MNIDWNNILKLIGAFAKQTAEEFFANEKESLQKLGEKGLRLGKITTEATAKFFDGSLSKKDYDEIRSNAWNSVKSELISKGYDQVARQGDILQNTLNFATSIASTILGSVLK